MTRPKGSKNKPKIISTEEKPTEKPNETPSFVTPNASGTEDVPIILKKEGGTILTPTTNQTNSNIPLQEPPSFQETNNETTLTDQQVEEIAKQSERDFPEKPSFFKKIWMKITLRKLRTQIQQIKLAKTEKELAKQKETIINTILDLQTAFYITYLEGEQEGIEVTREGLNQCTIQELIELLTDVCDTLEKVINDPK